MRTGYSPFDMCEEAIRLMNEVDGANIPCDVEKQIILLLNKAETYSDMSAYQLSIARKQLAEIYYASGITGSALEQFCMAQSLNPKIAVKKKLKELRNIPKENLVYSLDGNIVEEPNYDNLKYYEIEIPNDIVEKHNKHELKMAQMYNMTLDEYKEYKKNFYDRLHKEVLEEDSVFDPVFEKMIDDRLQKLGEPYISDFHKHRPLHADGILSAKRLTEIMLSDMEESFNYHNKKG